MKKINISFIKTAITKGRSYWIFDHLHISWMYEDEYQNQLPILYKLFAKYCKFQSLVKPTGNIIFGKQIFHIVAKITSILSLRSSLEIKLKKGGIWVNLTDPRFIVAVDEILHKPGQLSILSRLISSGDTFLDIGANHGAFSIIASPLVGKEGLIIAIEPQRVLAQLLNKTLSSMSISDYKVFAFGCGDEEKEVELFISSDNSGMSGFFPEFSARRKFKKDTVKIRKADQALDWKSYPGKLIIKIDVEGSEYAVLKGAEELIQAKSPIILLEINPSSLKAADVTIEDISRLLLSYGYIYYFENTGFENKLLIKDLDDSEKNIIILPNQWLNGN